MIKITHKPMKVARKVVKYNDLEPKQVFIWPDTEGPYLCIRTCNGHLFWHEGVFLSGASISSNPDAIPVHAELTWCHYDEMEGE